MHQEHQETNGTCNGGLNKSNLTKIHGRLFSSRRTVFKEGFLGSAVRFDGLIAINGRDETSFRESASIFYDCWIADEGLR